MHADDRYGAERHRQRRHNRAEQYPKGGVEYASSHRDSDRIVGESKYEVLSDIAHRRTAEGAGADNAGEIAFDQRDAGILDGNLRARSHRDTHIGFGQSGRIIHTIARHGDNPAIGAQFTDDAVLVFRQDITLDIVNAKLPGDGFGRGAVVVGQHHNMDAIGAQAVECGARGRFDLVRDRDDASRLAVNANEKNCSTLAPEFIGLSGEVAQFYLLVCH